MEAEEATRYLSEYHVFHFARLPKAVQDAAQVAHEGPEQGLAPSQLILEDAAEESDGKEERSAPSGSEWEGSEFSGVSNDKKALVVEVTVWRELCRIATQRGGCMMRLGEVLKQGVESVPTSLSRMAHMVTLGVAACACSCS